MHPLDERSSSPELQQMVIRASRALAVLDADRLEELALCCQALNRDVEICRSEINPEIARQARAAAGEMAVFARVLDATRTNLNVMNRLRELRQSVLEYGQPRRAFRAPAPAECDGAVEDTAYGKH